MRRNQALLLATIVCLLALAVPALAQGGYSVGWWSADGGGGVVTGNGYALSGTVGQAEAGTPSMSGGTYAVANGYWAKTDGASGAADSFMYLPVIEGAP